MLLPWPLWNSICFIKSSLDTSRTTWGITALLVFILKRKSDGTTGHPKGSESSTATCWDHREASHRVPGIRPGVWVGCTRSGWESCLNALQLRRFSTGSLKAPQIFCNEITCTSSCKTCAVGRQPPITWDCSVLNFLLIIIIKKTPLN